MDLKQLADFVYSASDFDELYARVVEAAPKLVTGCDRASLLLKVSGRYEIADSTDDWASRVDELEIEMGEGPCVDAIEDATPQVEADITKQSAWPGLASRVVAETPIRSMMGFRLLVDERKTGALNLFADHLGAFGDDSVSEGAVLASFLSVALMALSERQRADTLRAGLESNREIGKAVGLLMAYHGLSEEEAVDKLRTASQRMNVKVADLASRFVADHKQRK